MNTQPKMENILINQKKKNKTNNWKMRIKVKTNKQKVKHNFRIKKTKFKKNNKNAKLIVNSMFNVD